MIPRKPPAKIAYPCAKARHSKGWHFYINFNFFKLPILRSKQKNLAKIDHIN